MARDKKSFIFYSNWIHVFEKLSDEEAGLLIKHMLRYVNDLNPKAPSRVVELVFEPLRQALKDDLKKYESMRERNKINGAKGGAPLGNKNAKKQPKTTQTTQNNPNKSGLFSTSKKQPKQPKQPSGLNEDKELILRELNDEKNITKQPKQPKQAVNDNDNILSKDNINNTLIKDKRVVTSEKVTTSEAKKPESKKQEEAEKMNFAGIKDLWNSACTGYPKLFTLSDSRKNKIRLRVEEMGGEAKALPLLREIFGKMQKSRFLRGENKRGWRASFDWVFENDKNWVKVWEGNYDNRDGGENIGARQIVSENDYKEF